MKFYLLVFFLVYISFKGWFSITIVSIVERITTCISFEIHWRDWSMTFADIVLILICDRLTWKKLRIVCLIIFISVDYVQGLLLNTCEKFFATWFKFFLTSIWRLLLFASRENVWMFLAWRWPKSSKWSTTQSSLRQPAHQLFILNFIVLFVLFVLFNRIFESTDSLQIYFCFFVVFHYLSHHWFTSRHRLVHTLV